MLNEGLRGGDVHDGHPVLPGGSVLGWNLWDHQHISRLPRPKPLGIIVDGRIDLPEDIARNSLRPLKTEQNLNT